MEEDLKIVLTSELEADEQASARRISAQLPNIAKLINSRSNIKVGVTLDESNIQSQTQKLTQQIAQVTKAQGIGVSLSLDQSSVNKIRTELNNLKVNPDISRAMTDQLDQMGIQIDKITGRWEEVNGQQERMLNLTIQGTDQMGRTVTYLQTYDTETGNINTHLTNVTANLEKQRNAQEQLAKQAKADNESRVSYLTKQQALLADIQATYAGATSAKPVTDESHLTELNNTYSAINAQIQSMIANEGKLDSVQRSNLEAQISGLKRMVKEYQNAEYVATKLRTKDIGAIKGDQLSGLEALEKRLEAAGTLTDTFRQKIDGLKTALNGVSNKDQLVSFLNSFDQLNNDVSVFQERLRGVNNIYTQLIALDKQITSVQSAMTKLDPKADENKLVALRGQLAVLNNQKASLEAQLAPYSDIVQYAKQATALEQSRLMNGSQLVYTQMELADKAREYDTAMQRVPTTIADLQTKFKQVVAPTETLVQNMKLLRETAAQYSSDMGDREKVQTYERLQQLIGACSKEMSELMRVQRGEVNDFKFTQNLEKAKADLATVGRTWSALKQDPGLNAQFLQLTQNLKNVNNQMDLNKWTSQFSAFKSEVKAAGKNMQSLGDILKNNVSKVLQWVSATTLLFRAFRLLRTALSTIVDLDTAMIDLQKVTVATRAEYDRFYRSANDTAKALGVTTEEVISQTAEWARLGYAMQDAAKLAENSAIFKAISPGMDITMATDGLVSMLKAFDEIDVNDSLDGIISKVNDVGNKFAVSNKDIVEAMTRTSSAMKAANNTFEETVALATAAIEITRDAASVGNGLKTLSMRIRGYDEETEEYSEDVAVLTGAIADLTKVASNGNRGISIFEPGDPETYRSTYDILADIADIWDEMTDKNRASLLEVLFGKRQAQIGSAILSNFDQARKAIEVMEDSAGSANREMEKIEQSLEYKLNALQETWVGVAQNLFQTDDMKLVVDGLTGISNAVDFLTARLGLFGTIGVATAISLIFKFRASLASLQTTVMPVVNAIKTSGVAMDGSAASVQFYATKLMTLDKSQRAAAMSALGLTAEQRKQVTTMTALIASAQRYTIQELAEKASTDKATASTLAKNMAKATEKRTTEQISAAMMVEILNSKKLTAAQKQAIIASLEQSAANEAQAFSWKAVGANAKAALAAMATNPMTWVMLAVTAVMALVQAWQSYKQAQEEARQAAIEAAGSAASLSDEISSLTGRYLELSEAVKTDASVKEDLLSTQNELIDKLGLERGEIQALTDEYGNLTDAIKAASLEKLKEAERDLRGGQNAYEKELLQAGDTGYFGSGSVSISAGKGNGLFSTSDETRREQTRMYQALKALEDAGLIGSGSYSSYNDNGTKYSQGFAFFAGLDEDLETVEGILNTYDELGRMLDVVSDKAGSNNLVYEKLYAAYNSMSSAVEGYRSSISQLNTNLAEQYMLQGLIGKELPNNKEEFDAYRQGVIDAAKASGEFAGTDQDIANAVDGVLQSQSEFAGYYADQLVQASEETGRYVAQLQQLPEVLSALKSAYSALESAQEDMAGGGGLSADTIESLASAEANYIDYLYEENGVVKLNTEAWEENANAKMLGEMDEIQKEIDSLNEQNDALRENIAYYEEQRQLGSDGGLWSNLIAQTTADIEENNKAIEENQSKLAIYSSLYGSITGDLNAYTVALQNFSNVANSIDSITGSFQTLANLQAEVANGFTMSLDKALEFAKVYPEILNSAQATADGQILLNEGVVNSFIVGKKAELDAQIDTEVAKLEADKEVLQAKMEAAQAQLDLAKSVAEGEGNITKELAEYRINAGNIVAQALIDAGVDEATAFKLAAAAMAQNAEEFDRVAMEVCTDVNGNFNQAAYDLAQTMYQNLTNVKTDLASVATQAHETAKAIAGVANGSVAGSSTMQGGSGGGTGSSGIKLNLTSGSFEGTEYTYTAKESGLEDFISQIELDISNYQNAISQIDGQIAALQALKNAPLKSFKGSGTGSSGSGSSGGTKDVEEYIASIDEYREAVERLRKAQEEADKLETAIDNAGSFEKKIELQEKLIAAYREEQAALHNLNDMRDSTITQGVESLRELGFAVQYNADTNELWIENLDHLNELTADSAGSYDSLQEATNALREGTEDLINTITDLNDANREGSESWWELNRSIIETTISMYENMMQARKNAAMLAENGMDNAIDTKNLDDVKKFSAAMIAEYQGMQKILHEEAEYYRSLGYSDTSDEVSKLSDLWWDYADNIKSVKEQVVDYLIDIVDAAHDAVDEIQNVSDTLYEAADEFAANDGFITVDTYQALLQLGPQYMQMLKDENGLWEINEERINDVIAARTRQLAVENAMSYVERLKLAAQEGSIEDLNNLCFATTDATNSTWGLVYAELELMHTMGELNDSQYQAALHNIEAMQDLANNVVANIGKTTDAVAKNLEEARKQLEDTKKGLQDLLDELEDMEDGANDLVKYVMDMLKHRIQEQIDLLEEMKDKYSEIIDLKKDSLDATKDEQDYQKSIAKKLREMAKLQERINALSLDDSRSAQAERAKLLEEMAELQEDLADSQADKSIEAQKEALDQMEKDYHEEKDQEIKILEDSISSYQKLYDMAIAYIRDNWDALYQELIAWNTEYGSVLNSEITAAWEAAQAAAQRYGDFVSAIMGGISAEIDSITKQIEALDEQMSNLSTGPGSSGTGGTGTGDRNTTVGNKAPHTSPTSEDMVKTIVGRMKEYGAAWSIRNDKATNDALHQKAVNLARQLDQYGIHADFRDSDGTWWITRDELHPNNVGKMLHSCYHTGGFVGDEPLKPNEQYIKAENGELMMTSSQQDSLAAQLDRISAMADVLADRAGFGPTPTVGGGLSHAERGTINNITNNSRPIEIHVGDTIIQGNASAETVAAHSKMTEQMVNELARRVGVKW